HGDGSSLSTVRPVASIVDTLPVVWLRNPLAGRRAVSWYSIVFIVVAAIVVLVTLTLVRRRRARQRAREVRRRELEARRMSAIEIQRALAQGQLAEDPPVRVRIGLHTGEVTKQGRDLFGLNVAFAARVADEAAGGEILVSSAVKNLAAQADGVRFGKKRRVRL